MKDAFVSKVDRWGNLVFSTYLGGDGDDTGHDIAVGDDGSIYVTGSTASTDFPTVNPYKDGPLLCDSDAFVSKLTPSGDALVFSTYLGGTSADWGLGVAVDDAGYVYVGGQTQSGDFPTVSAYQTFQGARDACVTKLVPAGNALVYSTCLGGSAIDNTWSMALGGDGDVYITGGTQSTDYPTFNAYQTDQGNEDVFLTRLDATGADVVYSTYLGGGAMDTGTDVAVDAAGHAYVTGWTQSFDYPLVDPYQTNGNFDDVFVTKVHPAGTSLIYSTYLSGNDYDLGWGIEVDAEGGACVTGWTRSTDFPTQDPLQTHQGDMDAFLIRLAADGGSLTFGTYVGGGGEDWGRDVALDLDGNPAIAGYTYSPDFPQQNALQSHGGGKDAFVAVISSAEVPVDESALPGKTILRDNVPNPFNPRTTISFDLARREWLSIEVYAVTGQPVAQLFAGVLPAGTHTVTWDGRDSAGRSMPSGSYLIKLETTRGVEARKVSLIR
jgi:hypothetical protein